MGTKAEELKKRTQRFADNITQLVEELPNTRWAYKAGGQLFDAATSVAANYRAACKARSHAEFISKIGIVLEEADESDFWLNFIVRNKMISEARAAAMCTEASELTAMFTASHKTATSHKRRGRS